MELEIRTVEGWKLAGEVNLSGEEGSGVHAACELEYHLDYVEAMLASSSIRGAAAFSCHYDVDFAPRYIDTWPPFLLDLFPQGAALQYVVDHYRIPDQPQNYWKILNTAQLSPPGNIRVRMPPEVIDSHPGFEREEIIEKGPDFLEYMVECGAPVSGSTGAGGAAPKFLLREDHTGRFHADGVLADEATRQCWLVKYPRGERRHSMNRRILKAEKCWYDIAQAVGLRTHAALHWDRDCLFIPRFDRVINSKTISYLGMESFYSLVGASEFGSRFRHKTYTDALYRFSDQKQADLIEYLLRDILNIALANTDNHGRNHSVVKTGSQVCLSPLYDFAPMRYDPEWVVRQTRWEDEDEWLGEACKLFEENYRIPKTVINVAIEELWHRFRSLDLKAYDCDHWFFTQQQDTIDEVEQMIAAHLGGGG